MEMLKLCKLAALALAMVSALGCSSKAQDVGVASVWSNCEGPPEPCRAHLVDEDHPLTTFYFEYDSSDLKPEAMKALDAQAKDLKASGAKVVLEGNTDERGTREYNMALGERRAKAVQRYLVLQGVAPAQLDVVSYGEERPAAIGHDEQSWAENRRVELRK